ncbi:MAG: hypothetical protein V7K57_09115 [Nostoc sp.]
MSTSEEMDAVFLCDYDGAIAPNDNAESQAIAIANDEVSPTALAAPPQTWKEHWFDHDQQLSLVHHDEHVAVYYDRDVSRSVTWPFSYMSEVWQYTKKVYGKFGSDSRLYAIYHTDKYSGGHPSTYFDASHDRRNVNGNPIIAMVLVTLSTFKTSALLASFRSISLSFGSEGAAKKFFEDVKNMGCTNSSFESNNVVVVPDFGGSQNAAEAVYHAVNSYKDRLTSVNKFEIFSFSEEDNNLLKNIQQYIKEHFGSDAMTVN